MKPSDCPYAVGTPEHSQWIKDVLIPNQERDLAYQQEARERAGAETIGGKVIDGQMIGYSADDIAATVNSLGGAVYQLTTSLQRAREAFERQYWALLDELNDYPIPIAVQDRAEAHKEHQKNRKMFCHHGNNRSSCRKCH